MYFLIENMKKQIIAFYQDFKNKTFLQIKKIQSSVKAYIFLSFSSFPHHHCNRFAQFLNSHRFLSFSSITPILIPIAGLSLWVRAVSFLRVRLLAREMFLVKLHHFQTILCRPIWSTYSTHRVN